MKTPLRYQISEYDCGPTSLLNAVSFLFERESIPPVIVRNIMLYSLDTYNEEGLEGRKGTSRIAMRFMSSWLDEYGKLGQFPVSASYLSGEQVSVGRGSGICRALQAGGAAIVRLFLEEEHYVLFTGDNGSEIYLFDPYLWTGGNETWPFTFDDAHPFAYNRIVPYGQFEKSTENPYSLGPVSGREAVLIYNTDTMRREESMIEYFI